MRLTLFPTNSEYKQGLNFEFIKGILGILYDKRKSYSVLSLMCLRTIRTLSILNIRVLFGLPTTILLVPPKLIINTVIQMQVTSGVITIYLITGALLRTLLSTPRVALVFQRLLEPVKCTIGDDHPRWYLSRLTKSMKTLVFRFKLWRIMR